RCAMAWQAKRRLPASQQLFMSSSKLEGHASSCPKLTSTKARPALHSARFAQDCGMLAEFDQQLTKTLDEIKAQGLYKTERVITTPQDAHIAVAGGKRVLNLCANNYLGLADHPTLIAAAKEALDTHGFGMASVRFICGTQ